MGQTRQGRPDSSFCLPKTSEHISKVKVSRTSGPFLLLNLCRFLFSLPPGESGNELSFCRSVDIFPSLSSQWSDRRRGMWMFNVINWWLGLSIIFRERHTRTNPLFSMANQHLIPSFSNETVQHNRTQRAHTEPRIGYLKSELKLKHLTASEMKL